MSEVAGYNVTIKVSGEAVAFTSEATTTSDNQIYKITNTSKQVLDLYTTPTVYDNGVETVEDYTVNYLNGTITFGTVDVTRVITVDGSYLPMATAGYANSMSQSDVADVLDASVFGDEYKKRVAGQKSASGTFTHLNLTDSTYKDALASGEIVVIEIVTGSEEPDRYFALLEGVEDTSEITTLVNEVISWVSYDKWIKKGS